MTEDLYEPTDDEEEAPPERQALVINVQSWATPIVGLIMLALGLLGGYLARPMIEERTAAPAPVAAAPTTAVQAPANQPAPADDAEMAAARQEVMAFVTEQTRHFKGDPNAPVTLIEFSDFQ